MGKKKNMSTAKTEINDIITEDQTKTTIEEQQTTDLEKTSLKNKDAVLNAEETKSTKIEDTKKSKKKKSLKFLSKLNNKKNKTPEKIEVVAQQKIKRVKTSPESGLSIDQVVDRINKGYTNETPNTNVKTYGAIFTENIFTFFNMLCLIVAIALIVVGSYKNLLFMVVATANTAIGIIQEIKSKKTIEKLSLLTAPTTNVIRGGQEYTITTPEIVIDDIVVLSTGKQIVADCIVVDGSVEVNESLLTGESVAVKKKVGDSLLSGSFISSGSCRARVDKIGEDCYVEKLAGKAKQYKKPNSELFLSLNRIIKVIGFIVVPAAVALFLTHYNLLNGDTTLTIEKTAGAILGMVPSGMFLLSSIALTVSVIRLAQKKALVQDLFCVEMLARVNVLCLDKTGTITDGTMKVYNCIEVQNKSGYTLKRIIGSMLSALNDNNQTSQALINYFGFNKELKPTATLPFSSARKLSAVSFEGAGTYILGAPEFVLPNLKDGKVKDMMEQYAKDGYRVLCLASASGSINKDQLPSNRNCVAIIVLEDRIRDNAISTIKWFKDNDVKIKIISGDNPLTVAEIAKRVGVDNTDKFINLEGLSEAQVINAANKYTVFGRVTPEQKAILIKAIKADGNKVAMTGDGVNDILALKEADCSIAMASGSDAVRSVSHMVLMDSNFSSMPATVYEGRKVINNVQKSSALFFMKTIFSIVFSMVILFSGNVYPFKPIQLYMLEFFIIGLPSFFLALQPNTERVQGKFIYNLFKNALPAGLTMVLNCCAIYLFVYLTSGTLSDIVLISSMCTIIITFTGLTQLYKLCKPFNVLLGTLFAVMSTICFSLTVFAGSFFEIGQIGLEGKLFLIILILISSYIINFFDKLFSKIKPKQQQRTKLFMPDQIK